MHSHSRGNECAWQKSVTGILTPLMHLSSSVTNSVYAHSSIINMLFIKFIWREEMWDIFTFNAAGCRDGICWAWMVTLLREAGSRDGNCWWRSVPALESMTKWRYCSPMFPPRCSPTDNSSLFPTTETFNSFRFGSVPKVPGWKKANWIYSVDMGLAVLTFIKWYHYLNVWAIYLTLTESRSM